MSRGLGRGHDSLAVFALENKRLELVEQGVPDADAEGQATEAWVEAEIDAALPDGAIATEAWVDATYARKTDKKSPAG